MSKIKIDAWPDAEVEKIEDGVHLTIGEDEEVITLYNTEALLLGDALKRASGLSSIEESAKVDVTPSAPVAVIGEQDTLDKVEGFINAGVPMFIRYRKLTGEVVFRAVSAYEIRSVLTTSRRLEYVVGFDHYRDHIRNFRIDGIEAIAPAAVKFRPENS